MNFYTFSCGWNLKIDSFDCCKHIEAIDEFSGKGSHELSYNCPHSTSQTTHVALFYYELLVSHYAVYYSVKIHKAIIKLAVVR